MTIKESREIIVEPLGGYDSNGFGIWTFPKSCSNSSEITKFKIPEDLFDSDELEMFNGGKPSRRGTVRWVQYIPVPTVQLTLQEYLNAWFCAYGADIECLTSKKAIYDRLKETSWWRYPETNNIKKSFLDFYREKMNAIYSDSSVEFAVSYIRKQESTVDGIFTLCLDYNEKFLSQNCTIGK